ncbi:TolC family outer membrane protein [Thiothrix nivea]|uniref:Type I secretion outer membrane protein, TolC family n=1 Tax=Thiothrix nivea (strain ATCC 35100 / DSM 5205 / JP2) TaxID=870187 RepID=A0A656HGQ6_THINJ|nr:TolC family outer membrane protein [Thiothrix nivea]EIJ34676.1 type I secretion outer membrane protein, TolC family [Thiothrix nivea DSM 5205]
MKQQTLAILIAASLTLAAQQANAENLLQVYQQAKGYDAQFKALENNYLAILERKPQALAALKPQVSVSGSVTETRQRTEYDASLTDPKDIGNGSNATYTLGLSKSLYNGALNAQVKQADAIISQASAGLEAERENLILRTAEAYFNFLLAQDNLEFARTEKDAISRQLEQTRAYFEAGRSAITDVKEAESRYDLAIAQEINAINQLDLSREQLRVLTGGFYQTLNAPAANMPLAMPAPADIEQWVNTAKANNKQLTASKYSLDAAQTEIDRQRAAKKPVVDLVAKQTGSNTESNALLDPQTYGASVGVQVSMPLYTGGAISSKIREAQHSFQQAQQQYEFQDRTTEQQARNAFLTVQSSISQVKANQRALTSAETAAEATQAGFEVGTRTAVDVLTALRNVFSARRDYASARYTYLLNTLTLRQAAGTLSDQDIANMNQFMTSTPKQLAATLQKDMAASGEKLPAQTDNADQAALEANDTFQSYAAPETLKPGRTGQPLKLPAAEEATQPASAATAAKPAPPQTGQPQYFVIPRDVGKK